MSALSGKRIIVTGGAQGMGREHARLLAGRGARVAIVDTDPEQATRTVDLIETAGGTARFHAADVSARAEVERVVADVAAHWGGVDAVVSNAGNVHTTETLAETDDDTWDRTFRIHVGGALNLTRAAAPELVRSGHGRVVIVSSTWALKGPGFGYAYCAAKGALLSFMRNLAAELGPSGVCVNAVTPGAVPTRMAEGKSPERIAEESLSIPLRRWAEHDEVSGLVAFLCSDESSYVSGQSIGVNGALIPS
ncbi:SDR family NAD(P)-dependent oxidoreductase [Streptomyces sp. NPDC056188]|uniref:SDR family NAD(P)-dependent oxidoreductase n=1 Tax=Streptomyces sp. NPDC056188 TaxID=3345740 RepID=UPI0035E028A6